MLILSVLILLTMIFGMLLNVDRHKELEYNSIIDTKTSTSTKYDAVKFSRSINATTRTSYHLTIIDPTERFKDAPGNVYISYNDFDYAWEGNQLIIYIDKNDVVFRQESLYKDVRITYRNRWGRQSVE